ncbi:hypothetical protein P3H15_39450 [Rhodococcus sp. T2V]|uniref:hypothetical protein n=1 Tax=Rhodococcus sp. T2V TaxID=3034164 RepID=UPI0023E1B40A|nr:hypothetical protein [Rhodococcus sp. T2V]MDF3311077.1 hypothetical protein [Rhodococcus sp. T2V]
MPAATAAPTTAVLANAESTRAMILPFAPQARAAVIAERSWEAAPRPESVLPAPQPHLRDNRGALGGGS